MAHHTLISKSQINYAVNNHIPTSLSLWEEIWWIFSVSLALPMAEKPSIPLKGLQRRLLTCDCSCQNLPSFKTMSRNMRCFLIKKPLQTNKQQQKETTKANKKPLNPPNIIHCLFCQRCWSAYTLNLHIADLREFIFVVAKINVSTAAAFPKEEALNKQRNLFVRST